MAKAAPDSPTNNQYEELIDEDIDVELLIAEVKRRPALYVKSSEINTDKETKVRLWSEVCQVLFLLWDEFSPEKRNNKVKDVRYKWRNLKDAFIKKMGEENQLTPSGKKKRKYYYFDSLSFLIPTLTTGDINVRQDNNNESDLEIGMDTLSTHKSQEHIPSTSKIVPNFEETHGNIPTFACSMVHHKEIDENVHFALMLAPMMRKFNDEQRYFARTQILDIMRNISKMGQASIQICNIDQLKYTRGEETAVLREDQDPEEGTSTAVPPDSHIEDRPMPITVVRNERGEIQYPETDPEDLDA